MSSFFLITLYVLLTNAHTTSLVMVIVMIDVDCRVFAGWFDKKENINALHRKIEDVKREKTLVKIDVELSLIGLIKKQT